MHALATIAAGIILTAPAPAPAQPASHFNRTRAAQTIAAKVFPNTCPKVTILRGQVGDDGTIAGVTGPCEITFASDKKRIEWPTFCTTMVHEYGHLAGFHHVEDTESVMYWQANLPYPDCIRSPRTGYLYPYSVGNRFNAVLGQ